MSDVQIKKCHYSKLVLKGESALVVENLLSSEEYLDKNIEQDG